MLSVRQVGQRDVIPYAWLLKCWSSAVTPSLVITLPFKGKVKSWQLLQAEFIQRESGPRLYLYFVWFECCGKGSVILRQ